MRVLHAMATRHTQKACRARPSGMYMRQTGPGPSLRASFESAHSGADKPAQPGPARLLASMRARSATLAKPITRAPTLHSTQKISRRGMDHENSRLRWVGVVYVFAYLRRTGTIQCEPS